MWSAASAHLYRHGLNATCGVCGSIALLHSQLPTLKRKVAACESPRPVLIHLTGFGAFGDVKDNPTSVICDQLRAWLNKGISPEGVSKDLLSEFKSAGIEVQGLKPLEVSADACQTHLRELFQDLSQRHDAVSSESKGLVCIVHMGVSSKAREIHLECRGFNEADFRIPDVRGWQPIGDAIVPSASPTLYTSLPLTVILGELHDRSVACSLSTDPGRYICNYIFYSSLHAAKPMDVPVLFVHMPPFEAVDQVAQLNAVLVLLFTIARHLRGEGPSVGPLAFSARPLG